MIDPTPKVKRPRGGQTYEPTPRDRSTVQVMHANGISKRIIAKVVGIDQKTLNKHFRQDLADAAEQVEASMGAAIVAAAQKGQWGAAKYWLLVNSKDPRWKTPEPHAISGNPDAPPIRIELAEMSDDDIRRELDEIRDRARATIGARALAPGMPSRSNGVDH